MRVAYKRILNAIEQARICATAEIKRYRSYDNLGMVTHYEAQLKDAIDLKRIVKEHQKHEYDPL